MSTPRNTGTRPSRARHVARTLAAAAMLALVAACSDSPSAPQASATAPNLELVDPSVYASGIQRNQALDQPIVTRIEVDRSGGRFNVPGGLRLEIPSGLFKSPTALTVTTLAGSMVAYEFQPHGLVFHKPIRMTQDLRGTDWRDHDVRNFEIGYFADVADLSVQEQKALIREFLKANIDLRGQHLDFDVHHFSGYMVSWGRSR